MKLIFTVLPLILAACASTPGPVKTASAPPPKKDNPIYRGIAAANSSKKMKAPARALPSYGERGMFVFPAKNCSLVIRSHGKPERTEPVTENLEWGFSREKDETGSYMMGSDIWGSSVLYDGKPNRTDKYTRSVDDSYNLKWPGTDNSLKMTGNVFHTTETHYDNAKGSFTDTTTVVTRIAGVDVMTQTESTAISLGADGMANYSMKTELRTWDLLTEKQKAKIRKEGEWAKVFTTPDEQSSPQDDFYGSFVMVQTCTGGKIDTSPTATNE